MDIIISEHARYKLHTRSAAEQEVMAAIAKALADRSRMHRIAAKEDTYLVRVNGNLRAIIRLEQGRVILETVMQYEP